jgi:microcystin-dependent protein
MKFFHRGSNAPAPPARRAGGWRYALTLTVFAVLFTAVPALSQTGFLGQVKLFAGNFAPQGWHDCDGSLLPISENTALFALIGTTYGGDGQTTFALPDLRGRAAIGVGQGPGLSSYVLGETGGQENVTLTVNQLPSHAHTLQATSALGSSASPATLAPSASPDGIGAYASTPNATMNASTLEGAGGGQPHENMKPFLAVRYIICVSGIFPSRN